MNSLLAAVLLDPMDDAQLQEAYARVVMVMGTCMAGPSEAGALHVSVSHTHENLIPWGNAPIRHLMIKSGSGNGLGLGRLFVSSKFQGLFHPPQISVMQTTLVDAIFKTRF